MNPEVQTNYDFIKQGDKMNANANLAWANTIPEITNAISNWLTDSGVQIKSKDPQEEGGFGSWYDTNIKAWPFIYSEITGYMLTTMCWLYETTGEKKYLDSALKAGHWLLNTTHEPNGGFHCNHPLIAERKEFKRNQQYAFDNGIILNGLVCLYRATKDEVWLASAVTAADWLVNFAQKPNGAFYPVYQMDENKLFESDKDWSTESGSYHAKIAIGLLNLYDVTKKAKYKTSAEKVCDFAMGCQNGAGRFISFMNRGGTNSHPHSYSCEALWVAGKYLNREDYLKSSAKGVEWLLGLQNQEGIVPRQYLDDKPVYNERVDVLSQCLRMAVLIKEEGLLNPQLDEKLHKLAAILPSYQAKTNDIHTNGGFYFGKLSNGTPVFHVNVWVSAFAMQALDLYYHSTKKNMKLNPFFMV